MDGVYSADPRKVPGALKLDRMSLSEALAMARHGGRVLQADAVAYAHRLGIELLASATGAAEPGTRIHVAPAAPRIAAITADAELERFEGDGELLTRTLVQAGALIRHAAADGVLVTLENWHDRSKFTPPVGTRTLGRVAVVAVIGQRADADGRMLLESLATLRDAGCPPTRWHATPNALTFELDPSLSDRAVRALHDRLILAPKGDGH